MLWLCWSIAFAEPFRELEEGTLYRGGERVGSSVLGVSFAVPEGWSGIRTPGNRSLVLTSDEVAGVIFVATEPRLSAALTWLGQPLPMEGGVVLSPNRTQVAQERAELFYAGQPPFGGPPVTGHGVGVSVQSGAAFAVLAVGLASQYEEQQRLTATLIDSVWSHPTSPAPLTASRD